MKITRRPLSLNSKVYSREFSVERSVGCHLMPIVERIEQSIDPKRREQMNDETREALFTVGFLWEHVMARPDAEAGYGPGQRQLEHAFSVEAIRLELLTDPDLLFPGEMVYCVDCDDVMPGGEIGRDHCKSRGHKGIYFTVDGLNTRTERVREWKATWMSSSRTGPAHMDGIWKWPVQNMFYCKGVGLTGGELQALFMVGDHRTHPPFAVPYEFDLDYTERDLENNWRMIVSHARKWGMV